MTIVINDNQLLVNRVSEMYMIHDGTYELCCEMIEQASKLETFINMFESLEENTYIIQVYDDNNVLINTYSEYHIGRLESHIFVDGQENCILYFYK